MIDIHAHVIPFVDDGSPSLEDSLRLVKEEIEQGVDTIICTPHFDLKRYTPSKEKILENFELLKKAIKDEKLEIELYLGQEICYYSTFDFIKLLKEKKLFTLKDTNFILLEFDFYKEPVSISELMYNIRINGFVPIIAHVERYEWLTRKMLEKMIVEGALIQVNGGALINRDNRYYHKRAKKYVKGHYVNYIASDVHVFRKNTLKKAYTKYSRYLNEIKF